MDKFLGKWQYRHDLADANEEKFLDSAGFSREYQKKMFAAKPIAIGSKEGNVYTFRVETHDGELMRENKFELGKKCNMKTLDGRDATGLFNLEKDGKVSSKVHIEGIDYEMSAMMEIKDDTFYETFEVPSKGIKSIMVMTRVK